MKTFASLFSGFGGADIGAMQAGLTPLWGVEYIPEIAAVANANLGNHIMVADILDLDPATFATVDVLHASPPCPNFSVAKAGAVETPHDLAMAQKVAAFVTTLRPRVFTLENVWGYRNSQSWAVIRDALYEAGYWLNVEHVNAADFGVPQTRKRMIVRAILGGWVPYLPAPVSWVGWYAAIEDLLPTLPESKLAPWQLARLPDDLRQSLLWAHGPIADDEPPVMRQPDKPSMTLGTTSGPYNAVLIKGGDASGTGGRWRAVLVGNNANATSGARILPDAGDPAATLRTDSGGRLQRAVLINSENAGQEWGGIRSWSSQAMTMSTSSTSPKAVFPFSVVAMTPRCLARFQSFPDWYELPIKKTLAARGIGNAVPPLLYQRIVEGLL